MRFPRTPHVYWSGHGSPRDDKVLSEADAESLLLNAVWVEEKVDGANVGIAFDPEGGLKLENRDKPIGRGMKGQFEPLWNWINERRDLLFTSLGTDLKLFGEWCFAVHSVRYNRLPDWFLGFDVFDLSHQEFYSVPRRNGLLEMMGVERVPILAHGVFGRRDLEALVGTSKVSDAPMEGVYLRVDKGEWLSSRA